jgi:N4-gp56 family major capsid protein
MAGNNTASQFSSDIEAFIADETLPLARRQLVAYQFGDPLTLPKGRGTTYTATRYLRVPLPFQTLSEGVKPAGETMTINQVSATAQQWGDTITITDVAELTIKHPLFKKGIELMALQVGETTERNTFNAIMAGTQINYVNSRGARASLVAGDVLNPHEVNRAFAALQTIGAPRYMGDERTDMKLDVDMGGAKASESPRRMPHYAAIIHPLVAGDMRENSTVVQAWTYSDLNRLYNYELGEWGGIRFCMSNLVPSFTGVALVTATPSNTGGALAANTYYVRVTASDVNTQYETLIYQVSTGQTTTGTTGSLSVTVPSTAGYTYNVYVGTTTTPTNLGLSTAGPTTGPLAGQATQIAPGATAVITGVGLAQTPPAAPATGVTVYPTFVLGRGAYGQVVMDDTKFSYLKGADKSDPLNQLRVMGWKMFYGTLILNQQFFMRIESTSAFSSTFG